MLYFSDSDQWFLYALNPPLSPHHLVRDPKTNGLTLPSIESEPDQTIEILMTDLDRDVMSIFTKEVSADGPDAARVSHDNSLKTDSP